MNTNTNKFQTISKDWLILHSVGIKQGTIKLYQEKVSQLNKVFGENNIEDISYIQVQDLLNNLYKQQYAKSTIHKYKITMSQIFNYAIQEKIISVNPCAIAKIPKKAKVTKREPITDKEVKIIFTNTNILFGLYPFMLLTLGLRRSELAPLKYEDIDFKNNQIHINKIVNYDHNKPVLDFILKNGNKERFITMPDILKEKLIKYQDCKGYIFNKNGNLLLESQLDDLWCGYKETTGLEATQHMVRHTYATMLYNSEVDIKTAQYLMGHNDVRTMLQIYTHLSEEHKTKNIDKLNKYISKI